MRLWTLEQLAKLPEERAVQKHFDRLNYRVVRWIWRLSIPLAIGFFTSRSMDGDLVGLAAVTLWIGILFAMYFARSTPRYEEHFSRILPSFLLLSGACMIVGSPDPEFRVVLPSVLLPTLLFFLRLPSRHSLGISAALVAMAITVGLTSGEHDADKTIVLPIVVNAIFAGGSIFLSRHARRAFLEEWTSLAMRERERERMSGELADARKIQLAMLPGAAPDVGWLTIASASLPASEVGGDFYDHFLLPAGSVAISIGDVAGHGVASGLVLAGIKSGLHLLREELDTPVRVLERLNRLASEWLQWRMLVTLMIAVIEPEKSRVRVAAAGQTPLLIIGKDGAIRYAGRQALPLGTRLVASWEEDPASLSLGDTLVFYTDGLTELIGSEGEPFGIERLEAVASEAVAAGVGVDAMRDRILTSLQTFRGTAPQLDDISVVLARYRG